MAYLYQQINKIPGLSGSTFDKQKQYYNQLGAPQGAYTGSYSQNSWLMQQLSRPNYGLPQAQPQQTAIPGNDLASQYAKSVIPAGGVKNPTAFSKVVDKNTLINRPLVEQFAYSQIDPEINRIREDQTRALNEQQASTGMYRFGMAGRQQRQLGDMLSRQRQEMAQPFMQEGLNRLQDYYNTLEQEYYRDPQAFQYKPVDINKFLIR